MKKDLLSIGFMHGHNSSASLMINDRIVAAISEERFTRKKNSTDFPINSINFLIKEYGLNRKKIKFTHPSFIIPFSMPKCKQIFLIIDFTSSTLPNASGYG